MTDLRAAAGIRNAEMKWKNPDQLIHVYGVHLEGWPADVPHTNPSTLSVSQNKLVMQALEKRILRFVPTTARQSLPAIEFSGSSANTILDDSEMDVYVRYEGIATSSPGSVFHQVCTQVTEYCGSDVS